MSPREHFRSRSLQLLPCRRTHKCIASDRRHRPELSRYCKHQGDDGDGSAGFSDDLAPKDAKPDSDARTDRRCNRLYPELTRARLTPRDPFGSPSNIRSYALRPGIEGLSGGNPSSMSSGV
jgi:hypothetical protein